MKVFDKSDPETSFGVFKPVGNIVIVFNDTVAAQGARADLLKQGHEDGEVTFMTGEDFIGVLDELAGKESALAILGSEWRKVERFREHANNGASFLVVYAPDDDVAKAVMDIVEQYNYRYALKYGSMIIERFDDDHSPDA